MDERSLHAYARVLLRAGVNLQEGQNLLVRGDPVQRSLMLIIAEEAYRAGGRTVKFDIRDARHTRIRAEHLGARFLDYVPGHVGRELETLIDEEWALLTLDGEEDPDELDGVDKDRLAAMERAASEARRSFTHQMLSNRLTWCIAPSPTAGWARKVLDPVPLAPDEAVDELWAIIAPILRLDRPDPVDAWKEHMALLRSRARVLNEMRLDRLRFCGPGTDLEVGLMPRSRFACAAAVSAKGIPFIMNLPTEEIYTTPDLRRAQGKVTCTRPAKVMGVPVEGAAFEFVDGVVRTASAERGAEALEKFLAVDTQARRLGEVALVDGGSPVAQSGRIFRSILFDENAACHIALGGGCPDAVEGGERMGERELLEAGCNVSLVHVDFMIGSPEVSVTGLGADGRRRQIISRGRFVL